MNLSEIEKKLGEKAKLAVSLYLLDEKGLITLEEGYKAEVMMPMASTKKVAIALSILKKIYDDRELSLTTNITINNTDFSPGRPTNTLDRYYFRPWSVETTRTVDELLTYMLTESDNTSTDVLLGLAGGPDKVNELISELNIEDHHLSFTSKKLLADYFKVPEEKSISSILQILYEFISAYSVRPTENCLVESEEDACTAKMMTDLLKLLVSQDEKENWIGKAANVLLEKMRQCKTGETLIKKGAIEFFPRPTNFGSKQGGLGGIRNDTAFIQFEEGHWAILSIHTCQSNLSLKERDKIISDLAKEILVTHCNLQPQLKEPSEEEYQDSWLPTCCTLF